MNWKFWKRKPVDVIPNPRDRRIRRGFDIEQLKREMLHVAQFLAFALALLILAQIS